jgi:hypothetical protein
MLGPSLVAVATFVVNMGELRFGETHGSCFGRGRGPGREARLSRYRVGRLAPPVEWQRPGSRLAEVLGL